MPLSIVSQALGLPIPVVRVQQPSMLFAETINFSRGCTALMTYRSALVKDHHPLFQNVASLIKRYARTELLGSTVVEDANMGWREAEWSVHLLHEKMAAWIPEDPRVLGLTVLIRQFIEQHKCPYTSHADWYFAVNELAERGIRRGLAVA